MSKRVVSVVSAFVAVMMSVPAFAQESGRNGQCAGASGSSSVNQTFCFEPESVRGGLVGATGQTVRPLRRVNSDSLLRIRAHFVTEMMKTVENL
jgi:hypothetical protein